MQASQFKWCTQVASPSHFYLDLYRYEKYCEHRVCFCLSFLKLSVCESVCSQSSKGRPRARFKGWGHILFLADDLRDYDLVAVPCIFDHCFSQARLLFSCNWAPGLPPAKSGPGQATYSQFFCVVQRRSSRPNRKSVYSPMPFNLSLRNVTTYPDQGQGQGQVQGQVKVKVKVMVGLRIPVRIRVWIRVWSDPDTNSDLVSDPELNAPQCTALSLQSQSILSVHHNTLAESVLFWVLTTTCSSLLVRTSGLCLTSWLSSKGLSRAGCLVSVCLSVCLRLPQAGIVSKRMVSRTKAFLYLSYYSYTLGYRVHCVGPKC